MTAHAITDINASATRPAPAPLALLAPLSRPAVPAPSLVRRIEARLIAAFDWLSDGLERARQRRTLAALDERARRDLGLSAADAAREAAKPFWRG
jgi:uncharacterized protein YjiS (DUF1127 family)